MSWRVNQYAFCSRYGLLFIFMLFPQLAISFQAFQDGASAQPPTTISIQEGEKSEIDCGGGEIYHPLARNQLSAWGLEFIAGSKCLKWVPHDNRVSTSSEHVYIEQTLMASFEVAASTEMSSGTKYPFFAFGFDTILPENMASDNSTYRQRMQADDLAHLGVVLYVLSFTLSDEMHRDSAKEVLLVLDRVVLNKYPLADPQQSEQASFELGLNTFTVIDRISEFSLARDGDTGMIKRHINLYMAQGLTWVELQTVDNTNTAPPYGVPLYFGSGGVLRGYQSGTLTGNNLPKPVLIAATRIGGVDEDEANADEDEANADEDETEQLKLAVFNRKQLIDQINTIWTSQEFSADNILSEENLQQCIIP